MAVEAPVLKLGLAGFSAEKKNIIEAVLKRVAPMGVTWQLGPLMEADAWWVDGARVQAREDGMLRINPGMPTERSIQIDPHEAGRPVAFAGPVTGLPFQPVHTFDADSATSVMAILKEFSNWLLPVATQFSLAAEILRQEEVLGTGFYQARRDGELLAVVNLRGEIGLSPLAKPTDFDEVVWTRQSSETGTIPAGFQRRGLAELMWCYALRTSLDVLPARYRGNGLLYFRRAPRVPQRLMRDSHLLLLRELAAAPASFAMLGERTGLSPVQLANHLAALYLVGAITANPKRASQGRGRGEGLDADPMVDSDASIREGAWPQPPSDLTAPAPMSLE